MRQVMLTAGLGGVALLAGCRQDMHNQPKFYPQRGTDFYADGRSVRPQVAETVARGQLHEDSYFYSGLQNGAEGNVMPFPVTMDVLARGQEQYNVYCTPCHSRVGNGVGMIVQRGYAKAGNFHTARLRTAPLGHFFNVITNGYGSMPEYAAQVTPEDRWAIVAYIKALQLSQNADESAVPAGQHVQSVSSIAESEGLPANFAAEWTLPATAVAGTPDGGQFVLPVDQIGAAGANSAQSPAERALSKSTQPASSNPITTNAPQGQGSTGYPNTPVSKGLTTKPE
jgi:mono/diheme cytochrome c family protein